MVARKVKPPFDAPEYRKARGPNGRRLCRWCGQEVPKGRQSWCSDKCVDEYRIRSDSKFQRQKVFKRDRGVCLLCSINTDWLDNYLGSIKWKATYRRAGEWRWEHTVETKNHRSRWCGRHTYLEVGKTCGCRYHVVLRDLKRRGWSNPTSQSLWEADHIVPVVLGGIHLGLDNLRTLCVPCHKRETRKLAGFRAAERRKQSGKRTRNH